MSEKKKMNPFVKILLTVIVVVFLAVIFGIISGGVFLGVSVGGNVLFQRMGIVAEQPESESSSEEIASEPVTEEPEKENEVTGDQEAVAQAVAEASLTDVSDVVEEVMPSIVSIVVVSEMNYYGIIQEADGAGSGFIVGENDSDLFIATNYHVIEDTTEIKVQFCDNETIPAEVKGKNIAMDLAVLAIDLDSIPQETRDVIHIATLGESESLRVGEPAIAIGNALGYGQSVTTGVISALNREIMLQNGSTGVFIQTDAAINPGNSGGALLNTRGEVIGINSNKLGGDVIEGMGYAIPISAAMPIIEGLINKTELAVLPESEQAYLGISGLTVTGEIAAAQPIETPYGVYVSEIVPGSPAESAGLKRGDIIVGYDGNLIETMEDLKSYLAAAPAGTVATFEYMRLEDEEYVRYSCQVTLGSKTDN